MPALGSILLGAEGSDAQPWGQEHQITTLQQAGGPAAPSSLLTHASRPSRGGREGKVPPAHKSHSKGTQTQTPPARGDEPGRTASRCPLPSPSAAARRVCNEPKLCSHHHFRQFEWEMQAGKAGMSSLGSKVAGQSCGEEWQAASWQPRISWAQPRDQGDTAPGPPGDRGGEPWCYESEGQTGCETPRHPPPQQRQARSLYIRVLNGAIYA